MSEQIVEGIKYLVEKAKYFQKLKKSEDFLFQEINKIDTKVLIDIQEQYKNEEKIKKIRYETAKFLQNDTLNSEVFEKLKQGINAKYNTNIIKSWKNYSILYVLFFNEIKQNVDNILQEITHYFIEQSGEQLKFKISNFDGAQNFGETGCWLAIYNSKYKSQSEGTQYFINFYSENLNYGTYKHSSREYIQKQNYTYDDIGQVLVNEIADDIKRQKSLVLETENHTNGEEHMQETQPINQILYGPPGTGKTYNTINRALEIVFEKEDKIFEIFEIVGKESEYKKTYSDALQENDRESLKAIFDCYKERGQIEFVTFHQSYGYEEFVEGIKASTLDNEVKYSVESGIFKKLSKIAKENYEDSKSLYQSSLNSRPNQRYYIECPDSSFVILPGSVFPDKIDDGSKIKPLLQDDGIWRWERDSYLKQKELLVFKKTKNSPLVDENENKSIWNIYTKRYLIDAQKKGNCGSIHYLI